jgi:hypothetical protein
MLPAVVACTLHLLPIALHLTRKADSLLMMVDADSTQLRSLELMVSRSRWAHNSLSYVAIH